MPNRVLSYLLGVIVASGMIACGGSSSGGAAAVAPTPAPASDLPITPANAADITAEVIGAISSLFDIVEVANVTGLPLPDLPVANADLGIAYDSPFSGIGMMRVGDLSKFYTTRDVIVEPGVCDTGAYTNTWDDADNNLEVSTGDTMDVSFNACFFSDPGITLDGVAFITGINMTGDVSNAIPPWSMAANFAFVDLVGADTDGTATINGNFDIAVGTADGLLVELEFSGTQLTVVEGGSTDTLGNFSVTEEFDLVGQTVAVDAMGTLTSDSFNGSVSFDTPTSLGVIGSNDNPSSGSLMINHSSSSVLVTVIDNISVQLSIDADGDGTAETTLIVTWSDLGVG